MIVLDFEFGAQFAFLYVRRGSAAATNEMPVSTSSEFFTESGGAISSVNPDFRSTTSGTSYVLCNAVSGTDGVVSKIKRIEIVNLDTITDTVQFFYGNLDPDYDPLTAPITLQPNWSLHYEDNKGWYVLDENGSIVTGSAPAIKMCNYQYQYTASSGGVSPSSSPFNIPLNTKVSDINNLCSVDLSTGEITWNESGTFEIDVTMFYEAAGIGADSVAVAIYTGGGSILESGGPIGVGGGYNGISRLQTVRTVTSGDTWYLCYVGSGTSGYLGTGGVVGWYPSTLAPAVIFEATQLA